MIFPLIFVTALFCVVRATTPGKDLVLLNQKYPNLGHTRKTFRETKCTL